MQVTKRTGLLEEFDVSKLKKVIGWACENLDVNPLELERSLDTFVVEGISTSTIHDNLILKASNFTTLDAPDWDKVATRLYVQKIWKEKQLNREVPYYLDNYLYNREGFEFYIKDQIKKNIYNIELLRYTSNDLKRLSYAIDIARDFKFSYSGIVTISSIYLAKNELPQEMFMAIAMMLALPYKNKVKMAMQFYHVMSNLEVSAASPILNNCRKPDGSMTSCFTLSMNDSIESIYENLSNSAKISKAGGGVGIDISNLRGNGATLMGVEGIATGVLPPSRLFQDTALFISQGAGQRKGAFTLSLDVAHMDVLDFLFSSSEKGDPRKKLHDIFQQIKFRDLFFDYLKEDKEWYCFDPHELLSYGIDLFNSYNEQFKENYNKALELIDNGKLIETKHYNKFKASYLWKEFLVSLSETGLPYSAFIDTINLQNPNSKYGDIQLVNLCCVSGTTKLLTKEGEIPIYSLVDKEVEIWNGKEYVKVIPFKSGTNQDFNKYIFDNGIKLQTTPYHVFWVLENGKLKRVLAENLKVGDEVPYVKENKTFFTKVESIEYKSSVGVSYCVNEPNERSAVFNGILTGNCESFSITVPERYIHTCQLCSLNLGVIEDRRLEIVVKVAVRMLDATISQTKFPIKESQAHAEMFRVLGIGTVGLADYLARNDRNYYTGKDLIADVYERIALYAAEESNKLAKETKPFNAYLNSDWREGKIYSKDLSFYQNSKYAERWNFLANEISVYGIRNSMLLAVAPNTRTSIIQGATASFLPPYKLIMEEKNSRGVYTVLPRYIKDKYHYYNENVNFDQFESVDIVATCIQPWVNLSLAP